MAAPSTPAGGARSAGLAFAAALAGLCALAAWRVPWLLRGSIVEELDILVTFGAIVAVLAIGEWLWPYIAGRPGMQPPASVRKSESIR